MCLLCVRSLSHLKERKRKKLTQSLYQRIALSNHQFVSLLLKAKQSRRVAPSAEACPPALTRLALAHPAGLLAGRREGTVCTLSLL